MKFTKPTYLAKDQVYLSAVSDGITLERKFEGSISSISLEVQEINTIVPVILEGTKGWFSKPLLEEWLRPRLAYDIPASDLGTEFEGTARWQWTTLKIFKDKFLLCFTLTDKVKEEKVCISFEEEEVEEEKKETPISPSLTRRQHAKEIVMKARNRAARALFKAERLTQDYIASYGEDTDWEDSDLESVASV